MFCQIVPYFQNNASASSGRGFFFPFSFFYTYNKNNLKNKLVPRLCMKKKKKKNPIHFSTKPSALNQQPQRESLRAQNPSQMARTPPAASDRLNMHFNLCALGFCLIRHFFFSSCGACVSGKYSHLHTVSLKYFSPPVFAWSH